MLVKEFLNAAEKGAVNNRPHSFFDLGRSEKNVEDIIERNKQTFPNINQVIKLFKHFSNLGNIAFHTVYTGENSNIQMAITFHEITKRPTFMKPSMLQDIMKPVANIYIYSDGEEIHVAENLHLAGNMLDANEIVLRIKQDAKTTGFDDMLPVDLDVESFKTENEAAIYVAKIFGQNMPEVASNLRQYFRKDAYNKILKLNL